MARIGRPPKRWDATAWQKGFEEYLQSYEVRLRRRTDSYGAVEWPASPPRRITEERALQIALEALEAAG